MTERAAPKAGPEAVGALEPIKMWAGGRVRTIMLANVFAACSGQVFTVRSDSTDVVTVDVIGWHMRVAAVNPGTATVTITATDPDGATAEQLLAVSVEPPPYGPER